MKLFKLAILSSFMILFFQNCNQAGQLSLQNKSNLDKLSNDQSVPLIGPAVMDVVAARMPAEVEVVAEVKKEVAEDKDSSDECVNKGKGNDKDRVKKEVEQVMEDFSCGSKGGEKKVRICHFPPGNPEARHTICISENALHAHMEHGDSSAEHQDHLGVCE